MRIKAEERGRVRVGEEETKRGEEEGNNEEVSRIKREGRHP